MDILLHPTHPVSPNAINEDGITATYATLLMILKREVLDTDVSNTGLTTWELFWKALKKKTKKEAKLDLVLRCLLHCGGKVNFQKIEASVDGMAIIHSAAECGAVDMIEWLLKQGTEITTPTTITTTITTTTTTTTTITTTIITSPTTCMLYCTITTTLYFIWYYYCYWHCY